MKRILHICWFAAIIAACSAANYAQCKQDVRVNISPQVNHNSPVAVDIVLVSDKGLLGELMKMPASDWFAKREQTRRDHPLETGFDAWRWEWVPGQVVEPIPLSIDRKVKGGVVFVNYLTPGRHRTAIPLCRDVVISLGVEDFSVETIDRK
ncbi:MAG: hypothetical protein ACE5MG_07580 [Candidatus Methylomirabilales bacterium]